MAHNRFNKPTTYFQSCLLSSRRHRSFNNILEAYGGHWQQIYQALSDIIHVRTYHSSTSIDERLPLSEAKSRESSRSLAAENVEYGSLSHPSPKARARIAAGSELIARISDSRSSPLMLSAIFVAAASNKERLERPVLRRTASARRSSYSLSCRSRALHPSSPTSDQFPAMVSRRDRLA